MTKHTMHILHRVLMHTCLNKAVMRNLLQPLFLTYSDWLHVSLVPLYITSSHNELSKPRPVLCKPRLLLHNPRVRFNWCKTHVCTFADNGEKQEEKWRRREEQAEEGSGRRRRGEQEEFPRGQEESKQRSLPRFGQRTLTFVRITTRCITIPQGLMNLGNTCFFNSVMQVRLQLYLFNKNHGAHTPVFLLCFSLPLSPPSLSLPSLSPPSLSSLSILPLSPPSLSSLSQSIGQTDYLRHRLNALVEGVQQQRLTLQVEQQQVYTHVTLCR